MPGPKKSLGQHWLKDRGVLAGIAELADISENDTVLEVGPGLGTLTSELLRRAEKVVAVELDGDLARKLPGQFPGKNLEVVQQDILSYDLSALPSGYVVVANVPYYITSKIIQLLTTSSNPPRTIVLLVQREVAERLAAEPGDMSLLAVSAQVYAEISFGEVVPAALFTPPPKVDSRVVVLRMRPQQLVSEAEQAAFWRVVKAGFSSKRKKLRSSIPHGLHISKEEADIALQAAGIDPNDRAERLSIYQWQTLAKHLIQ
ncbi:ribosomal RNA small subunit methyltransferase A [Candidatus Saccharibacteria bacterium]|nr:ribosomal RNA small subunit methyltransferase A [Candidatus Saccharibacteria bacterium]